MEAVVTVTVLSSQLIIILGSILLSAVIYSIANIYGISVFLAPIKKLIEAYKKRKNDKIISFEDFEKLIRKAGYAYDPVQDIFYSVINAWQRRFGYCRFYDEMATHCSMIIDCEPFYFEYKGKNWLIEVWKGQYGMTTGCEIGIYSTEGPIVKLPGGFNATLYKSAGDDEMLYMSAILRKNGHILFTRTDYHWWLTGFILGEFSEPEELSVDCSIYFPDEAMLDAFVDAMKKAGYKEDEIAVSELRVSFTFDKPRTPQPITRIPQIAKLHQRKNKILCDLYKEITKDCPTMEDKINAIHQNYPQLFADILSIGKTRNIYKKRKSKKLLKDQQSNGSNSNDLYEEA
ncbi:MAG TPA: DUF4474 domain-containing protein [Clostridiales bacterium]|nr:DUF4474 domain-containing protein [Clostridiales bacterium]